MNLRAYAAHRKARGLRGGTHPSVHEAIKNGRLTYPAVRREGRGWVIDARLADEQWLANTDAQEGNLPPIEGPPPAAAAAAPQPSAPPQPAPPPPSPQDVSRIDFTTQRETNARGALPALGTSKAVKAAADAQMAHLELQRMKGLMVPVAQVEKEAEAFGRMVRDALLGVADRIAPTLGVSDAAACHRIVMDEIRATLDRLSCGS